MSALNISSSTFSVTTDGTNISLPVQPYMNGFTADTTDSEFTVAQTGTYLISYDIKMTSGLPMSSRVTLNGTPITNSINISSTSSSEYSVTFMQALTAGDILSLQFYGVDAYKRQILYLPPVKPKSLVPVIELFLKQPSVPEAETVSEPCRSSV